MAEREVTKSAIEIEQAISVLGDLGDPKPPILNEGADVRNLISDLALGDTWISISIGQYKSSIAHAYRAGGIHMALNVLSAMLTADSIGEALSMEAEFEEYLGKHYTGETDEDPLAGIPF